MLDEKLKAIDVMKLDGWYNFQFDRNAVNTILNSDKCGSDNDDVVIRTARIEDCKAISDLIMELAVFENFPDEPELSVSGNQG